MCITTVCLLNLTEIACSEHKQLRNNLEASGEKALGPADTISDFDYKEYTDQTPDLDYYNNFDEDGAKGIPDESPSLPATSEVNDYYLNVDLMVPHVSSESRGLITKRARDNDGNPMEHANTIPILDSRQYDVEVEDGTEAKLMANAISQMMYAQFNIDGNQYLMLDYIVDFSRSNTNLCCDNQNFVKMYALTCADPQSSGSCDANGRTNQRLGKSYLT